MQSQPLSQMYSVFDAGHFDLTNAPIIGAEVPISVMLYDASHLSGPTPENMRNSVQTDKLILPPFW
jgi:hypothetical protein